MSVYNSKYSGTGRCCGLRIAASEGLAEVIRIGGGEACGNGKVSRGQGTSADGRMVVAGVCQSPAMVVSSVGVATFGLWSPVELANDLHLLTSSFFHFPHNKNPMPPANPRFSFPTSPAHLASVVVSSPPLSAPIHTYPIISRFIPPCSSNKSLFQYNPSVCVTSRPLHLSPPENQPGPVNIQLHLQPPSLLCQCH